MSNIKYHKKLYYEYIEYIYLFVCLFVLHFYGFLKHYHTQKDCKNKKKCLK